MERHQRSTPIFNFTLQKANEVELTLKTQQCYLKIRAKLLFLSTYKSNKAVLLFTNFSKDRAHFIMDKLILFCWRIKKSDTFFLVISTPFLWVQQCTLCKIHEAPCNSCEKYLTPTERELFTKFYSDIVKKNIRIRFAVKKSS